jgi:hypothetical protein
LAVRDSYLGGPGLPLTLLDSPENAGLVKDWQPMEPLLLDGHDPGFTSLVPG